MVTTQNGSCVNHGASAGLVCGRKRARSGGPHIIPGGPDAPSLHRDAQNGPCVHDAERASCRWRGHRTAGGPLAAWPRAPSLGSAYQSQQATSHVSCAGRPSSLSCLPARITYMRRPRAARKHQTGKNPPLTAGGRGGRASMRRPTVPHRPIAARQSEMRTCAALRAAE